MPEGDDRAFVPTEKKQRPGERRANGRRVAAGVDPSFCRPRSVLAPGVCSAALPLFRCVAFVVPLFRYVAFVSLRCGNHIRNTFIDICNEIVTSAEVFIVQECLGHSADLVRACVCDIRAIRARLTRQMYLAIMVYAIMVYAIMVSRRSRHSWSSSHRTATQPSTPYQAW